MIFIWEKKIFSWFSKFVIFSCFISISFLPFEYWLEQDKKKVKTLTRHADTTIWSTFVKTSAFILAWIWITFININFTSGTSKTNGTITTIWSRCIDTSTAMFTRWTTIMTFINILHTISSFITGRTATNIGTIHWTCITNCASCLGWWWWEKKWM